MTDYASECCDSKLVSSVRSYGARILQTVLIQAKFCVVDLFEFCRDQICANPQDVEALLRLPDSKASMMEAYKDIAGSNFASTGTIKVDQPQPQDESNAGPLA